jgi:cytochrome c peroxidase
MKQLFFAVLLVLFMLPGCVNDTIDVEALDRELTQSIRLSSPTGSENYYLIPSHFELDRLPQDPKNPLTSEKVDLGSFLFFETGLGVVPVKEEGMQTYSCSSCHVPSADFKPGRKQGIGEGGFGFGIKGESRVKHGSYEEKDMDVQGIRPLSVLNVAFSAKNTLWNGAFGSTGANEGTEDIWGVHDALTEINHLGYEGLETQNIEGLNIHRMLMTRAVAENLGYLEYFDKAFPEFPVEERYSNITTSLAISAYLRTLTTTNAPFQKWLNGDLQALSPQEKRGALLFFTDANCTSCHSSPAFSATKFFAIGVKDLDQQVSFNEGPETAKKNLGRGAFTGRKEDMYKFKVPHLYNLQGTSFYFHGSSKRSIEEVVDYFDKAIPENLKVPKASIASEFRPLNLTAQEKEDLVAFLKFGLQDPTVERFKPALLPSGNCFPNADIKSKSEIGCE